MITEIKGRIPQLLHLESGIEVLRSERSHDIVLVAKFASLEDMQA